MFAAGTFATDHRSPFEERWGGWYVTGDSGSVRHLGNAVFADPQNPQPLNARPIRNPHSVEGRLDTTGYLTPYSDIVALLTFEHQMRMVNLLTRVGWEIRYALYEEQRGTVGHDYTLRCLRETSNEIVDYLLFVDEAPPAGKVQGSSGFAEDIRCGGALRSPWPLAARVRFEDSAHAVSVQLHDLFAGLRCAARRSQE